MNTKLALALLLLSSCCFASLGAQVVGKPVPPEGTVWSNLESWVATPALEYELKPLPSGLDVFVFIKVWDQPSRDLLLRADALAKAPHDKPLAVRAFAEKGSDLAEVKAFRTDVGVSIPLYKPEPEWFSDWIEVKELPWVVVVKWTSTDVVTFTGVEGFEKAIEESLEKAKPDPCPRWSQSKQKTRTALKDAISAAYKYQFAKAEKEAESAVANFKGEEAEKKDLEEFCEEFKTQAAIVRGSLTLAMEKLREEGNWLRLKEALVLQKKWFDFDDAWLDKTWKALTKDPKVQKEVQRQEAFQKLVADTKANARKDRAKSIRDFAKKNKGSLAATWADDMATDLELADKKMNPQGK